MVTDETELKHALSYSPADTILLPVSASPMTLSGTLTISGRTVTLRAEGSGRFTFRRDSPSVGPVIEVDHSSVVKLEGIEITGGLSHNCSHYFASKERTAEVPTAAGIESQGTLTLQGCAVHGNRGPGVRNNGGTLVVLRSSISDNKHAWKGGGLINLNGDTLIENSTISRNHACKDGAGVYHYGSTGRLVIAMGTMLSDNTVNVKGSALSAECEDSAPMAMASQGEAAQDSSFAPSQLVGSDLAAPRWKTSFPTKVTIMDSVIERNSAGSEASVYISKCNAVGFARTYLQENQGGEDGGGLAVYDDASAVWMHSSVIRGNNAANGAGIAIMEGKVRMYNSAVLNNAAEYYGGGVQVSALGSFEATATNFSGNTAAQGGSHIYSSGDVSLAKGSGVDGDDDKGLFNGNRLEYILPAPLGRYLSGVFQCKEFLCSTVFGLVPCSNQPCNASLQHGAYMALSAQGYIPDGYFV